MGNSENVTYVENDTEQSYTYNENGIRTDLSILSSAGDDPACISHASYQDGEQVLDEKLHISPQGKGLLSDLLKRSKFL
ncbi:MAG TPA: hypothetical protein VF974_00810 [Patescibacteria group bacterium]